MGWKWHKQDQMKTTCILLYVGNHASTSSLNFYRLHGFPVVQPAVLIMATKLQSTAQKYKPM